MKLRRQTQSLIAAKANRLLSLSYCDSWSAFLLNAMPEMHMAYQADGAYFYHPTSRRLFAFRERWSKPSEKMSNRSGFSGNPSVVLPDKLFHASIVIRCHEIIILLFNETMRL